MVHGCGGQPCARRRIVVLSRESFPFSIGSPSIDSFGLPYPVFWHGGYFNLETKEFDHLFAHEHISFKTKNEINITEEHFISLLHRYRYAEEISYNNCECYHAKGVTNITY